MSKTIATVGIFLTEDERRHLTNLCNELEASEEAALRCNEGEEAQTRAAEQAALRKLMLLPAKDSDVEAGDADREPGILGACQDLHMLATVSADGMPDSDSLRLEVYLQRRLDGWAKHAPITALHGIYDETIRMLVTVTLAEWRACPWHPRASRAIPAALGENRP